MLFRLTVETSSLTEGVGFIRKLFGILAENLPAKNYLPLVISELKSDFLYRELEKNFPDFIVHYTTIPEVSSLTIESLSRFYKRISADYPDLIRLHHKAMTPFFILTNALLERIRRELIYEYDHMGDRGKDHLRSHIFEMMQRDEVIINLILQDEHLLRKKRLNAVRVDFSFIAELFLAQRNQRIGIENILTGPFPSVLLHEDKLFLKCL